MVGKLQGGLEPAAVGGVKPPYDGARPARARPARVLPPVVFVGGVRRWCLATLIVTRGLAQVPITKQSREALSVLDDQCDVRVLAVVLDDQCAVCVLAVVLDDRIVGGG